MEGIRNAPKPGFELLERSLENSVNALAKHMANPKQFVADELRRVRWKVNERKEFVRTGKRRIAHVPAKILPKPIVSITCY